MRKIKNKLLSQAELQGQSFDEVVFEHCRLDVAMKSTSFTKCKFFCCDFSGATMEITSVDQCEFPESKLSNIDWSGAKVTRCKFDHAVVQNCVFQQLKPGDKNKKVKMNLKGCSFVGANLMGTVFVKCELNEVKFEQADLEKVIFEQCNLTGADLRGAKIERTNFDASVVSNTLMDLDGLIRYGQSKGFVIE